MRQGYRLGDHVLRHALVGVVDTVDGETEHGDTPQNAGESSPQNAESDQ